MTKKYKINIKKREKELFFNAFFKQNAKQNAKQNTETKH